MKIAICHLSLTTESGDPRMVFLMARELMREGHQIAIYTAEFDALHAYPNLNHGLDIRVVPPSRPLTSVRSASSLLVKIFQRLASVGLYNETVRRMFLSMDKDFEILICENDYTYSLGKWYKSQRPQTKTIWIMNNPPFFHSQKANMFVELLSLMANSFERRRAMHYAAGIDRIVVYDESNKEVVNVLGRPIKIIANPVDLDRFYAPVKGGIDPAKPIQLLSVGALTPQRRFEDTIAAAAQLRNKGYDARALIICKDFYRNVVYREKFEKFIRDSGIADHVTALFEGAPDDRYLAAMHDSQVFVHPNDVKIWGVGAFEAMAAGLPLIVSRITAVAGVLRDGENALFVDVRSPAQIATRVDDLIQDRALFKKIATAGQEYVQDSMSLPHFIREVMTEL
ncbi:MAG: glycosyltransferase family 4 protein [Patescibacteria group bacterium]